MKFTELFFEQTSAYYVYVARQLNDISQFPIVSETYVKLASGRHPAGRHPAGRQSASDFSNSANIRHVVRRHRSFSPDELPQLLDECREYGVLSSRPYQLGQSCDGSIDACVWVLLHDFLRKKRLSMTRFIQKAYPEEEAYTKAIIKEIVDFGIWQGVTIPSRWNATSITGLIRSLHNVNHHSLAQVIERDIF